MAKLLIQNGDKPVHRRPVDGHAGHVGGHAAGLGRVEKRDLGPACQIDIDGVRHRQQPRPHLAPQLPAMTQRRHRMGQRHQPVEIRPAQPDAVAGQNLDPIPRPPEHREIRGPAADIDDQPQIARAAKAVAGQRRRLGFGQEIDRLEPRRQIAAAQVGFRLRVALGVIAVEMHRTAGQRMAKPQAEGRLGALAQLGQKGRDDLGQRPPLAADQPGFVKQRRPQHAFQRPHIAALDPLDQRVRRGLTDAHRTTARRKKHGGGQGLGPRLDGKAADPAILHDCSGGIRGSEIDGKPVIAHRAP